VTVSGSKLSPKCQFYELRSVNRHTAGPPNQTGPLLFKLSPGLPCSQRLWADTTADKIVERWTIPLPRGCYPPTRRPFNRKRMTTVKLLFGLAAKPQPQDSRECVLAEQVSAFRVRQEQTL